jgi:hypothetical protein
MDDAQVFSASDDFLERHPSFKKRNLTLDLDLGLSLDQDFERVIEAQKVRVSSSLINHHTSIFLLYIFVFEESKTTRVTS